MNKVKRVHERGRYDKKPVHAILDAALVCHIAYVIDGRPYCTPTCFWREGEPPLLARLVGQPHDPQPEGKASTVCLTVTHLDALVMARSGFHHSVNYRAVMAFGKAHVIDDPEEKLKLMDRFIDRIYPGRSTLIRQPNKQEFKATTMIGMEIEHGLGQDPRQACRRRGGGLRGRSRLVGDVSDHAGHRRAVECAPASGPRRGPTSMADFVPGRASMSVMTKTYKRTFGEG